MQAQYETLQDDYGVDVESYQSMAQNNNEVFMAIPGPDGSPFSGLQLLFKFAKLNEFPNKAPEVYAPGMPFHPNVHPETNAVCIEMLNHWDPDTGLIEVVEALIKVMREPEISEISVNDEAKALFGQNKAAYDSRARQEASS